MKDVRTVGFTASGKDAAYTTISSQLRRYDAALIRAYDDAAVLRKFFGFPGETEIVNKPYLRAEYWKKLKKPGRPATSADGREKNVGNISHDLANNNYVVTNQYYELLEEDMDRAKASGLQIDTETAVEIGNIIGEEMDYKIMNGHDETPAMTGILEEATIQDAGAPSGVWDVAGEPYDSILLILGKLRAKGWGDRPIDMLWTPGLLSTLDKLVSDGTTGQSFTYNTWLTGPTGVLKGGKIFSSSHPFTATGGPSATDKLTGTSGGADNWILAKCRGVAGKLMFAYDLRTRDQNAPQGDISKNVQIKYTWKGTRPDMMCYMDAIDTVT